MSETAFLLRVPDVRHDIVRGAFVAAVVASPTQDDSAASLRELRDRKLGPDWLRALVDAHPAEARALMSRTVRWVQGGGGKAKAAPDEQRRFWNARCERHVSVVAVAQAARCDTGWVHRVEQGEVVASRAHMAVLWGALGAVMGPQGEQT